MLRYGSRDSLDSMVKITVGHSKQEFSLHKGLLCNIAPYFDAALNGSFTEGEEQRIDMPEEDVEVFKYFQLWAYTDCILTESETEKDISSLLMIKLYIFAEARCMPRLQKAVIDLLLDKTIASKKVPFKQLNFVYANTADGSLLRRLFVDLSASTMVLSKNTWVMERFKSLDTTEFLFDLINAQSERLASRKVSISNFGQSRSQYYAKTPVNSPNGTQVSSNAPGSSDQTPTGIETDQIR